MSFEKYENGRCLGNMITEAEFADSMSPALDGATPVGEPTTEHGLLRHTFICDHGGCAFLGSVSTYEGKIITTHNPKQVCPLIESPDYVENPSSNITPITDAKRFKKKKD